MLDTEHQQLSEQELIRLIREGQSDLFEVLLDRHLPKIYGLLLRMTANPADGEDLLQEVCLLAFSKIDTFRGDSSFGTWLYRIALNTAYMKFRRDKRVTEEDIDGYLPRFDASGNMRDTTRSFSVDPEDEAIRQEIGGILQQAIQQLPIGFQAVLVARDIEGLSTRETADALELSTTAVKSRLHRARLILRRRLEQKLGKHWSLRSWLTTLSGAR